MLNGRFLINFWALVDVVAGTIRWMMDVPGE
jgi:hypothetical protein